MINRQILFGSIASSVAMASVLLVPVNADATPNEEAHATVAQDDAQPRVIALRVGKVVTMNDAGDVINNAVVVVRDGKIAEVGRASDIEIPEGAKTIEMKTCWLVPGLVEGHNHINADSGDLHDYVFLTNPGLRTLDAVDTENASIRRARAGGVTSALLIPGSGTNMSGFGTFVKMSGGSVEDSIVKFPASIKIAQAGNPERYWYGVGRRLMNYNTRQTLLSAKAYHDGWLAYENGERDEPPVFNPAYDDFRGLFEGEYVASVHTQIYQVVMTTIDMLANRLDIMTTLDHSTFDGYKAAPLVREHSDLVSTINGPRQFYFDRSQRRIFGNAARWWQGGVSPLGINTDSPVVPQEELSYQATMASWYGLPPYEALEAVTIDAAKGLMVDDRVGSIEVGKDADLCIWSGDPIDPRSVCWINMVDGKIVHDGREDRRF